MKHSEETIIATGIQILNLSYELAALEGDDKKACEKFILEYISLLGVFATNEARNQNDLKIKLAKLFEG